MTITTSGHTRGRYDVIVVGARAAGAATAMLLARQGASVLVVDRSRYGADTLSTHALMRTGVIQLHRWGVLDRVIAAGTPPIRRTTIDTGSARQIIEIKPSHGIDALYAPRRTVLDPILVDAARMAGADVKFGISATDVIRDATGRVLGIEGQDRSGQRVSYFADLTIGADGIRSTIADRVNARVERAGTGAMAFTYGYWEGLETDGFEWVYQPNATAGVIPTNDGKTCVFAAGSPSHIGNGGLDVMRRVIGEASPSLASRLADAVPPAGARTFRGRPGHMRRAWGPGWALVGDAGYWKDPTSAHGLTDALRDAELLARAIVASTDSDVDLALRLADYQATRDALSTELFDTIDLIAAQQWSADEISDLLVQVSASMKDEIAAVAAFDAVAA
jgi:2-polyprenyl-6-methoxyphenol hydroxylase-like FAD-dependent oxidoreductase